MSLTIRSKLKGIKRLIRGSNTAVLRLKAIKSIDKFYINAVISRAVKGSAKVGHKPVKDRVNCLNICYDHSLDYVTCYNVCN